MTHIKLSKALRLPTLFVGVAVAFAGLGCNGSSDNTSEPTTPLPTSTQIETPITHLGVAYDALDLDRLGSASPILTESTIEIEGKPGATLTSYTISNHLEQTSSNVQTNLNLNSERQTINLGLDRGSSIIKYTATFSVTYKDKSLQESITFLLAKADPPAPPELVLPNQGNAQFVTAIPPNPFSYWVMYGNTNALSETNKQNKLAIIVYYMEDYNPSPGGNSSETIEVRLGWVFNHTNTRRQTFFHLENMMQYTNKVDVFVKKLNIASWDATAAALDARSTIIRNHLPNNDPVYLDIRSRYANTQLVVEYHTTSTGTSVALAGETTVNGLKQGLSTQSMNLNALVYTAVFIHEVFGHNIARLEDEYSREHGGQQELIRRSYHRINVGVTLGELLMKMMHIPGFNPTNIGVSTNNAVDDYHQNRLVYVHQGDFNYPLIDPLNPSAPPVITSLKTISVMKTSLSVFPPITPEQWAQYLSLVEAYYISTELDRITAAE